MDNEEQEFLDLLQLDLTELMMELADANKKLPKNKQLPQSFFSVYIVSIHQWFDWQANRPAEIADFDRWAECWGYNDIHFLKTTFNLTSEQEEVLDRFAGWAMSLKMGTER